MPSEILLNRFQFIIDETVNVTNRLLDMSRWSEVDNDRFFLEKKCGKAVDGVYTGIAVRRAKSLVFQVTMAATP